MDLAHLLADPEAPVRVSAARAVSVRALLRLDPGGALPFVASFFDRGDAAAEAAAIALGESRSVEALPLLRGWLDRASRRGLVCVALLAIASLRRDEAVVRQSRT